MCASLEGGPSLAVFETWGVIYHFDSVRNTFIFIVSQPPQGPLSTAIQALKRFCAYAYQETEPVRLNTWNAHKSEFTDVTKFPH
jgi:hypothetical protein